jgi:hypothetical protein
VGSENAPQVIKVLRGFAEQDFPAEVISVSMFDDTPGFDGFAIAHGGGLTIVYTDTTNQGQWWVQASSGLAIDVPDPGAVLAWVNNQNRTQLSKYYCAIAQEQGLAAAVNETQFYGDLLWALMTGTQGQTMSTAASWLRGTLKGQVTACAADGAQLRQAYGGRSLPGTEQGVTNLFVISSS